VLILDRIKGDSLLASQIEFSDRGIAAEDDSAPLTIKITALPSAVTQLVASLLRYDRDCTIQAHAGTGVIIARFAKFQASDLTSFLVGQLRPAAIQSGGGVSILSSGFEDLTSQVVWGGRVASSGLMEQIKQKFDPHGILNPGRFIFQA
jgi:FAD/FMN-containing dehydrogenase